MDKKISGVMALSLVVSSFAGFSLNEMFSVNDVYYCESTELFCVNPSRLSNTAKTCYEMKNGEEAGKRCLSEPYWRPTEEKDFKGKLIAEVSEGCVKIKEPNTWRCYA